MSGSVPAEPAADTGAGAAVRPDAAPDAARASFPSQRDGAGTTRCANCGAPLAGRYCSDCGQRHHDRPVYDLGHFVGEAFEDLTHADSRLWQTLAALLFRPGFLTREFLEGRRARYLPPVRLYLVISVIFFVLAGLDSQRTHRGVIVSYNGESFQAQVIPSQGNGGSGGVVLQPQSAARGAVSGPVAFGATPAARQRACEQTDRFLEQKGRWLARFGPRVMQSCLVALGQGGIERLNQDVEHNIERAMFLLLPLLALVMKPLYRKPPRHYVEHLLFFLHDHAFLFVALGVSTLLGMITSSRLVLAPLNAAIAIYVPIYFYRAMLRVYGQGALLTLSKLVVLGGAYFFLGILMLAATVFYSFLML